MNAAFSLPGVFSVAVEVKLRGAPGLWREMGISIRASYSSLVVETVLPNRHKRRVSHGAGGRVDDRASRRQNAAAAPRSQIATSGRANIPGKISLARPSQRKTRPKPGLFDHCYGRAAALTIARCSPR
jgi:hypothetical protein